MHGLDLVAPVVVPAEEPVARQVGEVGDRPVRVAERVRGLADAVRLDAVADLAARVGRPARLEVVLLREVAVGALGVRDPVGADHARVADVDDVRRVLVDAEAKAGEEDGGPDQEPHRNDGPSPRGPIAAGDPEAAGEQPEERRVGERHGGEDVPSVEEPQRHRE